MYLNSPVHKFTSYVVSTPIFSVSFNLPNKNPAIIGSLILYKILLYLFSSEILGILIDNARDAILSNKTTQNNWENIKDNNECGNERTVKGNNDCEKKENITIKIAETEKKVIVEVSNPYTYCTEDEIIKMFEKGYSTKGEDRGIGLNKIKEYQDKYKFDILVENIMTKIGNTIKFSVIIEK